MKTPELRPEDVAARLHELRSIARLETVEEATRRLEAERPRRDEPFEVAVKRRLDDLRALMELTDSLHRRR